MVIILIGPMKVGKSTVARLLAERLGLQRYGIDKLRWSYFAEIGYDASYASKLADREGVQAVLKYWKPFEVHAVERHLADANDCVIDLGAGYSVQDNPALRQRIRRALAHHPNVVLLEPTADRALSSAYLAERVSSDLRDANDHYLAEKTNRELARLVVYTIGKTPQETCDEVIEKLGLFHTGG
jgi:shikimate kinase